MIKVKTQAEIEIMRESGQILARTLKLLESEIRPGISTKYLDKIANEYIISCGGKPAFLHLYGFPASICSSIDDVVVHGIPRESDILQEGQIIGIDCGVKYKGFCSDAARTFGVGHISDEKQKLIDVTRESFFEGIKGLKANNSNLTISFNNFTFITNWFYTWSNFHLCNLLNLFLSPNYSAFCQVIRAHF